MRVGEVRQQNEVQISRAVLRNILYCALVGTQNELDSVDTTTDPLAGEQFIGGLDRQLPRLSQYYRLWWLLLESPYRDEAMSLLTPTFYIALTRLFTTFTAEYIPVVNDRTFTDAACALAMTPGYESRACRYVADLGTALALATHRVQPNAL